MIGEILGNRYEITEKVGGGGMAIVYKAKCNLLNRHVAVKVLRREFVTDKDLIEKFKKESQSAASMSHPNIVNVYDVGETDEIYYIVMEFVEGKTLKEVIMEKGSLGNKETIYYARHIAFALKHAHDNHIIHRDIKPHNILITEDNRAKVTDFGIALAANSSTIVNKGSIIGSVHYFSPEQARGGYTDEKSDLYSLGIVMYEMATGRLPFDGDSPINVALMHVQEEATQLTEINPDISKSLEKVILKLMRKEQTERYQNTSELITDLDKLKANFKEELQIENNSLESSPTQTIPVVRDEDIKKHEKRSISKKKKNTNKLVIAAALILALTFAVVAMFSFFAVQDWIRDFFVNKEVTIPDFIGENIANVENKIRELELSLIINERYDTSVAKEVVISQQPNKGMVVKKGFEVSVVVSKGARLIAVPNLEFKNVNDVSFILKNEGLVEGEITYEFSSLPIGTVITQSPKAGIEVAEDTKIDTVVSKGPEIVTLIMPNLVGNSIESGRATLERLGLRVGSIREEDHAEYAAGIVISQSIAATTEVEEGTVINLIISKKEEVVEPSTSTRTIEINLENIEGTVHVQVFRILEEEREEVFEKHHNTDTEGKTLRVSISGTGVQSFEIYIDGVKESTPLVLQF
ncbi:MAG: Stk1 family PASTA domain-containing Ser/Thr kinase [Alkaliphilus sp.]